MGVEGMAVCLARHWGVDVERALLAAVLHDLCKSDPWEVQQSKLEACTVAEAGPEDHQHRQVWHGFAAAHEAHERFGLDDPDVLHAVAYHTTGTAGLGPVGLTLYAADFLEPSRNWPGVEEVRRHVIATDPVAAARFIAPLKLEYLAKKGTPPHPRTAAMAEWLVAIERNL